MSWISRQLKITDATSVRYQDQSKCTENRVGNGAQTQ